MKPAQAEQNLQVIRTLMERATLYHRALGPIMVLAGGAGVSAAVAGFGLSIGQRSGFVAYWLAVAVAVVAGVFLLTRRQALRDREPVWSLPTRRVTSALAPPLAAGLMATGLLRDHDPQLVVLLWLLAYAAGLHAAGFFAPAGLRYLGWGFALFALGTLGYALHCPVSARVSLSSLDAAHLLMGVSFGGFHLLYGLYLLLDQRHANTP